MKFVIEPAQTHWSLPLAGEETVALCALFVPKGTEILGFEVNNLLVRYPVFEPSNDTEVRNPIRLQLLAIQVGVAVTYPLPGKMRFIGCMRLGSSMSQYCVFQQTVEEPGNTTA